MRALVSLLLVSCLIACVPRVSSGQDETLLLDGVIVTQNPAESIALVRREGAARARPLRVGQEYSGFILLSVSKHSVVLEGTDGPVRLYLSQEAALADATGARDADNYEAETGEEHWIQRDFSRIETRARLEKEIPVILSDTELTPRVEEGQVRGLELLRLPDGTVLSETGLLPGDVLRSINDEPLRGLDSLWKILARHQNGDELRVVVERRGEIVRLAYAFTN